MTDKELLELAAKAAGVDGRYASLDEFPDWMTVHDGEGVYYTASQAWNPLTDDGDAFRLAVELKIDIEFDFDRIDTSHNGTHAVEYLYKIPPTDPYAATRRAITRAAAEIGKIMGEQA